MKGKCITDPSYEEVNNCHERAMVFMHKVIHDMNSILVGKKSLNISILSRSCF